MRLLRIAGGALPDRRRPARRARPHRLRGLYVGHPRIALLGPGTAPAELLHRPAREGRDLRRRREAVQVAHRTDRLLRAESGLHLFDVHRGRDRRRRGGRLPPRGGRERHSRAARPLGRLQGHEEGRLPRGMRRHRHAGGHRVHRRHQQAQHQHPRRFQPGRRNVDDPRLLQADGRRGGGHDHRRRPRGRHPPRPRGRAERRAMLRLDGPPGQGHGAEVRHPLPARLLLRHRRHVAGPVRRGRFLRRRRA